MEEILTLAFREIVKAGFEEHLAAGVVLTGGTALTPGVVELAEQIFNVPVRCGYPTQVGGLSDEVKSPLYATAVGLLLYAKKTFGEDAVSGSTGVIGGWVKTLKNG